MLLRLSLICYRPTPEGRRPARPARVSIGDSGRPLRIGCSCPRWGPRLLSLLTVSRLLRRLGGRERILPGSLGPLAPARPPAVGHRNRVASALLGFRVQACTSSDASAGLGHRNIKWASEHCCDQLRSSAEGLKVCPATQRLDVHRTTSEMCDGWEHQTSTIFLDVGAPAAARSRLRRATVLRPSSAASCDRSMGVSRLHLATKP